MATLNLTVPDAKANKVYDAFARAYNDPTVDPTGPQKLAFVKTHIINFIKETVFIDELNEARKTATAAVGKDEDVAS